jgi:hypothetical protein
MASTFVNTPLTEIAQKSVTLVSGLADNLAGVSIGFGMSANKGDIVKVPVVAFGANSTEDNYATDGSSSVTLVNVTVNTVSKQQMEVSEADFGRLEGILTQAAFNGMVTKAAKGVTDAAYGLINTTNFAYASNKIVTGVAETALTLTDLYKAVGAALALNIFDPTSIKVVAPIATYARIKAEMDKQFSSSISLQFELVPNFTSTTTFITDKSAAGVAIGGDPGVNKQTFVEPNTGLGYSLKVFHDDRADKIVIAPRFVYGVALLGGPVRWLQVS